jgi:NIMA (never in mitosis gene a)-related kinase 1/4/5
MITLKPPFRAENMEGLYNKVIKGQISKIPDRFSSDMWEVVKMLIQVAPEARPNCGKTIFFKIYNQFKKLKDQILKHHIIQKRIEYFKAFNEESEDQCLMQTIRIPKNLLFLSDKLPQPNYEKTKNNNSFTKKNNYELPDIRQINNRKKPKNKDGGQENLESSLIESDIINPQVASIKKKSPPKENVYSNQNVQQLNNSNINHEDDTTGIKIIEKREKSPSG